MFPFPCTSLRNTKTTEKSFSNKCGPFSPYTHNAYSTPCSVSDKSPPALLPESAGLQEKQRNPSGGNLALPGEQKNFQRLAHGTGKKLAMEKEADQMRRIAHDTGKKKRPAPVSHGRSEGDFPNFSCHAPAGGAPKSGGMLQKKYSIPRGNSAQAGNRQAASSGRKVHPAGKPPGQARRRKIPIGGLCPPFSLQQVSPPGPAPTRQKANAPPGRNTNRSTQAGPRYTESRYRPFPQRNMFRPAPSAVHVPSSHGKTPSPIPRREGCGIFSLPEGREQKKALQEDEVRLKAAGL